MSGSYTTDGEYMAELVRESGHTWDDFFIFSVSGTDDFAYSAFMRQIMVMGDVEDGTFRFADNEADGNLAFLEREGYTHNGTASFEYLKEGLTQSDFTKKLYEEVEKARENKYLIFVVFKYECVKIKEMRFQKNPDCGLLNLIFLH